ncbi:MAG: hypothetical protein HYU64_20960 [Armatimonadetes bacterium]|nr:hypothetical protein [Armatimonadota bacterium]
MGMRKLAAFLALLFFAGSAAYADDFLPAAGAPPPALSGMVTRLEGDQIRISLGKDKGMAPGKELYVYRMGRQVAQIRVTKVEDLYSWAQAVAGQAPTEIRVGDVVTDQIRVSGPSPQPPSQESTSAPNLPRTGDFAGDPLKEFQRQMVRHSKSFFFAGMSGKGAASTYNPSVPWWDMAAGIYYPAASWGTMQKYGYTDPYTSVAVIGSIIGSVAQYNQLKTQAGKTKSSIEVILWDHHVADAYVMYFAHKEAAYDLNRISELRTRQMQERSLERNIVFQVRIQNNSFMNMQFSPFNWHAYLVDSRGRRYRAERYDGSLDTMVAPQQQVEGYIYFPRYDPETGSPIPDPDRNNFTFLLEDIYGKGARFHFNE